MDVKAESTGLAEALGGLLAAAARAGSGDMLPAAASAAAGVRIICAEDELDAMPDALRGWMERAGVRWQLDRAKGLSRPSALAGGSAEELEECAREAIDGMHRALGHAVRVE